MLLMNNLIDLGQAYRKERKALGKTQAQIASNASLRRETIIRIEAGQNVDTLTLLKAISALGKGLAITSIRPNYDNLESTFSED